MNLNIKKPPGKSFKQNFPDTSQELKIYQFKNGIKLVNPDNDNFFCRNSHDAGYTIFDLFRSSFNVYFVDVNGVHVNTNQANAENFWDTSIRQVVGKTIYDIANDDSAKKVLLHDRQVISSGSKSIIQDLVCKKDDFNLITLTIRIPWYNDQNSIIGLLGCSVTKGRQQLAESLSEITRLGLLMPNMVFNTLSEELKYTHDASQIKLTKRQQDCLVYLVMGMTARQIAYELGLSKRTVEYYLETTKVRMNCENRSELIKKALTLDFVRKKLND